MDILVTQGRRARRPYIFGINTMKIPYPPSAPIRVPHPRPSAKIRVPIRENPRPPSAPSWSNGYFGNLGRRARRPYIFGINAMKKTDPHPRKSALHPRKSAFPIREIRVKSAKIRVPHIRENPRYIRENPR
jgi:hypothetical protein